MTAATVVRPLSHLRPTLKRRVAAMGGTPTDIPASKPTSLWCGQCAHPNSDHDDEGCNHIDTTAGPETLCTCTAGGGAE